jgi:hypothetical protein
MTTPSRDAQLLRPSRFSKTNMTVVQQDASTQNHRSTLQNTKQNTPGRMHPTLRINTILLDHFSHVLED